MAKELRTEIEINASPERVWQGLTDFASFPEWNPFVRKASGELIEGARVKVHMKPSGSRGMTYRPKLAKVEPGRELRWVGGLAGLFDYDHAFIIEPVDSNHVRFVQHERFTGLLSPLFAGYADRHTRRAFEEMNQALKERAQATQSST